MDSIDMRAVLASFSDKKVLVTGHTGFKGTWLSFLLNELGSDVMGCALAPEPGPSHFELLHLERHVTSVLLDIRDAAAVHAAVQSFQPEYVFHLAAQAIVRRSYQDPVSTLSTNIMGSVNLLEAVRHCSSVRSLVYITSDKCYENMEWMWGYREIDRLGGNDPYSASKAAAELVFSAYAHSYFSSRPELGAATARAGNVIGGGDWAADRIVPDCIRAAERSLPVQLRNPHATRPWQHVLEPISGYLLLAARLRSEPGMYGGSWNFGPSSDDVRTVEDVAVAVLQALGRERPYTARATTGQHEAQLLQLNCDKAHQLLGWRPRWSVEKTLSATAEWYAAVVKAGASAEDVTRRQLHDYFPELT